MSRSRIVLTTTGIVVASLVAIVFYLYTNLGAIVKREIESYGSNLTGTTVSINRVSISPTSGEGTIEGLHIANPPGFGSGTAFELEKIHLKVDPSTITGNPIVVEKVIVASPKLHYDMGGLGKSNISTIIDNVKQSSSGADGASSSSSDSDDTRIVVRYLSFEGGELDADTAALLGGKFEARLPGLTMHDVGGARGGSPGAVGKEILSAYGAKVAIVVATKQIEKTVKSQLENATGAIPGSAGKAVNKVVDDVFNLLPGGKD